MSGLCEHKWWDLGSPYRYRNENLERMGFRSYREYLRSDLWKAIRHRVLTASRFCQACGNRKATTVHHRAYDVATLQGTCLNSLSAVCRRCHFKGEQPMLPRQDGLERLGRMNHLALKKVKLARFRNETGVEASPRKLKAWKGKSRFQKEPKWKPKESAFTKDMRPRLVKT